MKYSIITFGCRVNQADSLGFEERLLAGGATAESPDHADLVIVNTCSVTASADQGARQMIRRIGRSNPSAQIIVTGCYATRRPDEVAALPGVVRVVPNDDKPLLWGLGARGSGLKWLDATDIVQDFRPIGSMSDVARDVRPAVMSATGVGPDFSPAMVEPTTAVRFGDGDGDGGCGAAIEPGVAGRTAFTLRVQTGCAEPCAYCIIPTTRGAPRSVPLPDLLREVDRVAGAGFKEIALTGVHLGWYGRDLNPRSSLIELLNALAERSVRLQPDLLFRISSLEPMDCTREVVALVAEHDCFAPHFHLPLQHASNRVLAEMCRPYTVEQYASLVDDIRRRIPDAAIGSDVIVGFPGETDEDLEELATYLEGSPITHVHVFPYSDRPSTAATGMPGKVPGTAIRERARRIRQIAEGLSRRFRQAQVGTVHRALTLEDGSLVVTGNYLKLRIPPGRERNEWVNVRVIDAGATLTGEIW